MIDRMQFPELVLVVVAENSIDSNVLAYSWSRQRLLWGEFASHAIFEVTVWLQPHVVIAVGLAEDLDHRSFHVPMRLGWDVDLAVEWMDDNLSIGQHRKLQFPVVGVRSSQGALLAGDAHRFLSHWTTRADRPPANPAANARTRNRVGCCSKTPILGSPRAEMLRQGIDLGCQRWICRGRMRLDVGNSRKDCRLIHYHALRHQ